MLNNPEDPLKALTVEQLVTSPTFWMLCFVTVLYVVHVILFSMRFYRLKDRVEKLERRNSNESSEDFDQAAEIEQIRAAIKRRRENAKKYRGHNGGDEAA